MADWIASREWDISIEDVRILAEEGVEVGYDFDPNLDAVTDNCYECIAPIPAGDRYCETCASRVKVNQ